MLENDEMYEDDVLKETSMDPHLRMLGNLGDNYFSFDDDQDENVVAVIVHESAGFAFVIGVHNERAQATVAVFFV